MGFILSTTPLPRQEGQPVSTTSCSLKVKPGAVVVERQAQGSLCLKGRVASLFTQPNIQLPFSLPWLGLSSLCPGLLPVGLNQQGSVGTLGRPLSMNLTQASCPLVNGERALRFFIQHFPPSQEGSAAPGCPIFFPGSEGIFLFFLSLFYTDTLD